VPALWVAALVVLAGGAGLGRIPVTPLGVLAGAYAAAVLGTTLAARRMTGGTDWRWLPLVFPVLHASWGAGFWAGWLRGPDERRPDNPPRIAGR
jgi:hypothetical protein